MTIKVLGGLTIENLASDDPKVLDRIQIQKQLYEQGFTQGIQLRVGHDFTNSASLDKLIEKINKLEIPYIVHGPATNLGVDLGKTWDEKNIFKNYILEHLGSSWEEFSKQAIMNASKVAMQKNSLCEKIVLHPGYTFIDDNYKNTKLVRLKNNYKDVSTYANFSLETVPTPVIDEQTHELMYHGFGAIPKDMIRLLGKENVYKPGYVTIDFTHLEVTANTMKKYPDLFENPCKFEQLVEDFLELGVSNFMHFSGHTDELWDIHPGFINLKTFNRTKQEIINNALREIESRYNNEIYVALEIMFNDLDTCKREIDAFMLQYDFL